MSHQAFQGTNKKWGVEEGRAILYESDFTQRQAERLAELEDSDDPPEDWFAARKILEREGLIPKGS